MCKNRMIKSPLRGVISYCIISFAAISGLSVWPHNADKLLVILPYQVSSTETLGSQGVDQTIFDILSGTDITLVDQLSDLSFVVAVPENADNSIVEQLYQNGAFLVLNAAGFAGCGKPEPVYAFRRRNS